MKVSIITISYNSAETIEATLRSVAEQSHPEIEHILIDGGSSDGTLDIAAQFENSITHLISEPDKGIYDGMNKGLKMASGTIVGILNSDDVYADNKVIEEVVNKMSAENSDALYADLVYVDRNNLSQIKRYWKSGIYKKNAFRKGWMPPHPTFFVRKKIYDQYGYFDTRLKSAADYEIMLRFIHRYRITLSYLPRVIVKMRLGGQSNVSLRNRLKANKEDRLAWKMNGMRPGLFTLIRKPLSKITQFIKKGR